MIRSAFRISKWMGGHILTSSSSILSSSYVLWNLEVRALLTELPRLVKTCYEPLKAKRSHDALWLERLKEGLS
jgi:hypothetical protein